MPEGENLDPTYVLDDQIGYKLRLANQKHLEIFARELPGVTPTQFAVLARLTEVGQVSQNHLGRLVRLDGATIKGVVSRLVTKGLVETTPSQKDRRRLLISLTGKGIEFTALVTEKAFVITDQTGTNLNDAEKVKLNELLDKL
ncbi:MAG: MarR family transcriptional regulator [Rhodobacteraceae bacterium]|nr:MarR family transcriptional regulator [Paracoccaceae bacterium]